MSAETTEMTQRERIPIHYPAERCRRCGDKIKGCTNDDRMWRVTDAEGVHFLDDDCADCEGNERPRED